MNKLKYNLKKINPIKDTLLFKLLDGLNPNSNLANTIELYCHIKKNNDISKQLNQVTFHLTYDYEFSQGNDTIYISNAGLDIIEKFSLFSNSIHTKNSQNQGYETSKNAYLNFIQTEITSLNITQNLNKKFLKLEDIKTIENIFENNNHTDNNMVSELIKLIPERIPTIEFYPIFSLLTNLNYEEVISTLQIWLDKKIITKDNFKKNLKELSFDNLYVNNFISQQVIKKEWDSIFKTFKFMDVNFKDLPLLITQINDVEIIKKIIEVEKINPYEEFMYNKTIYTKKQVLKSSLHLLISQSDLTEKQKILEMFSKTNFNYSEPIENIKATEFLNLMLKGGTITDLKNFMKIRDLKFADLINKTIQDKDVKLDVFDIVKKHNLWWIIPNLVTAESEMIKKGIKTSNIFAKILHIPHDSKYSNALFNRLKKIINKETLAVHYDNIVDLISNSFSDQKTGINISSTFIKKPNPFNDEKNILKITSIFYEEKYKEQFNLVLYQKKKMNYDTHMHYTFPSLTRSDKEIQYYYLLMYCVKNENNKKDVFFTDINKIEATDFIKHNIIDVYKLHQLLTDYYFGSKIFPVSIENGEKMEEKLIDILSDIMYNIYKDNTKNQINLISEALVTINYILDTLYENTQDYNKLHTNIVKNDYFNDNFLSFVEILKNHTLKQYSLHTIKEKTIQISIELYQENLEFNTNKNNINIKIKKF